MGSDNTSAQRRRRRVSVNHGCSGQARHEERGLLAGLEQETGCF